MKPRHYRVLAVMEELIKYTLLMRIASSYLTIRYSERKEHDGKLKARLRV